MKKLILLTALSVALSGLAVPVYAAEQLVTDYGDLWTKTDIAVKVGETVQWYVHVPEGVTPKGCGGTVKVPGYGAWTENRDNTQGHIVLAEGENFIYELTPAQAGDILYTCWMGSGCHKNVIHVTDGETSVPSATPATTPTASPLCTVQAASANAKQGKVSGGGVIGSGRSVTVTAAAQTGYQFDGWYEGGQKIAGAGAKYTFPVTKATALTAKFKPKTYKITYKLNGGKLAQTRRAATFTYGKGIPGGTLVKPARKGKKFAGWYSDKKLKKRVKTIKKTNTKNITLYAKWK